MYRRITLYKYGNTNPIWKTVHRCLVLTINTVLKKILMLKVLKTFIVSFYGVKNHKGNVSITKNKLYPLIRGPKYKILSEY